MRFHSSVKTLKFVVMFLFPSTPPNSVRLGCESVIYRRKIIVCTYQVWPITQSSDNSTLLYLRQSNVFHPLNRGLVMVEVEGIAPSSCPSFDLYHQIVILFIPNYSSIVKFNFSLFAICSSAISSLDWPWSVSYTHLTLPTKRIV